jgi:predicted glycoside hydrolase/deacetylase ChbG (UPF0249 family)
MRYRSLFSLFWVFVIGVVVLQGTAIYAEEPVRLIIRGDDLGMTQGSLVAFEKAFNNGVMTAASIVVPGPWFEGVAAMCRKNPGWNTGVHLCLVGEWRGFRWRPVLPWNQVSSIVDEDGFLYSYPNELFAHKPRIEEIEAELRAQVDLAIKKGVNVQYLDTHYLSASNETYPGLGDMIRKIAADYDLPLSGTFGEKNIGIYSTPVDQKLDEAVRIVSELEPGLYLWICHPGIDSPEQRALVHSAPEDIFIDGGVGIHRAEVLRVLQSLELKSVILKRGIQLTNYRDLWKKGE